MTKRADMPYAAGRQRDQAADWIYKGMRQMNEAIQTNNKSVLFQAQNSFNTGLLWLIAAGAKIQPTEIGGNELLNELEKIPTN